MPEDFDFGKVGSKLDVSDFKPKSPDEKATRAEEGASDRAAERAGFKSREPVERLKRIRKGAEPLDHAYVRAPVSVINRFKAYCNDNDVSYGEALADFMRRLDI